jgi:glycosyltransferase involved in cell wall biosynthesis
MHICHIREYSYPVVIADGVGSLIYKLSGYLFKTENSHSSLVTRQAFGLQRSDKRGNITIHRVGLDPPRNLLSIPKVGEYSRRLLFSVYSKDPRFLYNRNVSVEGVSAMKKLAEEAANSPALKNVDVFHCHGIWTNFETYIGLFLSKRLNRPLIFQLQGHFGSDPECMNIDQKKPWYDPTIGNAALKRSKAIICGNKSTVEIVKKRTANRVKLAFIPTCVDTNLFHPKKHVRVEPSENMLFVGRLTNFKDPITPIRAMKLVTKARPRAMLRIVGGGPLAKKIQLAIKELGLEKNVTILGERTETRDFYQESAIFLITSTLENFLSNCLLEAMSSGLAVIATDVGETRSIIENGENGILVPPSQPRALASAILSLLSNRSLYYDLSKNAIKTAKQYGINTIGPKYARLYKEVLSEM